VIYCYDDADLPAAGLCQSASNRYDRLITRASFSPFGAKSTRGAKKIAFTGKK
jgi:hypothetical protein